ncbi:MAG: Wadjet anti-phage system protein JetD domain-containing protein [Cyanobacteria bacterium J06634_6]
MIDPPQIHRKASRAYVNFLRCVVTEEQFFPLNFPIGQRPKDLVAFRDAVIALKDASKTTLGFGYCLELEQKQLRNKGTQTVPTGIYIDQETDYLKLLRKESEVQQFRRSLALIRSEVPGLEDWLADNVMKVVEFADDWSDLLKVCQYFQQHPQPNLYIRQLPIAVHTKFVEQHKAILRSLLEHLLPDAQLISVMGEKGAIFEKRFSLKYIEPTIRLRFLDATQQASGGFPVDDVSLPVSALAQTPITRAQCLITENLMNFLTLPPLPGSFALFGGGYAVQSLKSVSWLKDCPIFYWGDLDAQGFQILSSLRAHFPQATSLMMNHETFELFKEFAVPDKKATMKVLHHLTRAERAMYTQLATQQLRLEQEHIDQPYVESVLAQL